MYLLKILRLIIIVSCTFKYQLYICKLRAVLIYSLPIKYIYLTLIISFLLLTINHYIHIIHLQYLHIKL